MSKILFFVLICFSWTGALADNDVAATAAAHAQDSPVMSPAASTAPRRPVTGNTIIYGRVGDQDLHGYIARPADAGNAAPGLIVIHEWWGLNDNIRQTAERLAGEGYVALAIDLYNGQSASVPKEAIKLMQGLMANTDQADDNLRQAYRYLDEELGTPRVGSIGWCLGGRWSLRTAVLLPDRLNAAVIYYGTLTTDEKELASLHMPVLGNFAERDPIIPIESVEQFSATMKRLGKSVDVKIYSGAKHAFANPSGISYDAAAAEDAWRRSMEFLKLNLQSQ